MIRLSVSGIRALVVAGSLASIGSCVSVYTDTTTPTLIGAYKELRELTVAFRAGLYMEACADFAARSNTARLRAELTSSGAKLSNDFEVFSPIFIPNMGPGISIRQFLDFLKEQKSEEIIYEVRSRESPSLGAIRDMFIEGIRTKGGGQTVRAIGLASRTPRGSLEIRQCYYEAGPSKNAPDEWLFRPFVDIGTGEKTWAPRREQPGVMSVISASNSVREINLPQGVNTRSEVNNTYVARYFVVKYAANFAAGGIKGLSDRESLLLLPATRKLKDDVQGLPISSAVLSLHKLIENNPISVEVGGFKLNLIQEKIIPFIFVSLAVIVLASVRNRGKEDRIEGLLPEVFVTSSMMASKVLFVFMSTLLPFLALVAMWLRRYYLTREIDGMTLADVTYAISAAGLVVCSVFLYRSLGKFESPLLTEMSHR